MKRAPCWQKSAALNSSVVARCGLSPAYWGFGVGAQVQGEHQQAVVMFRRSLDAFTELGGGWWLARLPAEMSRSVFARGNDNEARRVWREALHIATDIHGTPVALETLFCLSSLQAKHGDWEYALELLLMVLNHPASFQETENRAAHPRAEVQAHLTSQQVEAAQIRVQTKILETAVDEVLKQVQFTNKSFLSGFLKVQDREIAGDLNAKTRSLAGLGEKMAVSEYSWAFKAL